FATAGCGIRSCRSISPTDCCDEAKRPNIARRFGSAMTSNTDSTLCIYFVTHMLVKVYIKEWRRAEIKLLSRNPVCEVLADGGGQSLGRHENGRMIQAIQRPVFRSRQQARQRLGAVVKEGLTFRADSHHHGRG